MEDDIYLGPPAGQYNAGPEPGYQMERYPFTYHNNIGGGMMFITNERYLLNLYDAAGFRVTNDNDLEFLVRDDETGTMVWSDISELEVPASTSH